MCKKRFASSLAMAVREGGDFGSMWAWVIIVLWLHLFLTSFFLSPCLQQQDGEGCVLIYKDAIFSYCMVKIGKN